MNLKNTKQLHWNIINILFHPVFIPLYCVVFLIYHQPQLFANNTQVAKDSLLINTAITMIFLPLFAIFLLRKLNFVDSIMLHNRKERIAPIFIYTICAFFFWAFILLKNPANQTSFTYNYDSSKDYLKNFVGYPKLAIRMGLAFFLTSSIALVANAFFKISLHTIGGGLFLGFMLAQAFHTQSNYSYILFALIIAVLLFFARKNTGTHVQQELVAGFALGLNIMLACMFIAF
jgi:hypothetical protein